MSQSKITNFFQTTHVEKKIEPFWEPLFYNRRIISEITRNIQKIKESVRIIRKKI